MIIGTGRCGTGYVAAYLTGLGIPCSHEGYFTPEGPTLRNPERPAGAKGDASWLAAPFVRRGDLPIVHLVRRPRDVIRSLYNIGFFDSRHRAVHRRFIAFAERHFEVGDDPFDACVRWYLAWNARCEAVAGLRIRVEDFEDNLPDLASHIGFAPTRKASVPPATFNSWMPLQSPPASSSQIARRLLRHPHAAGLAEMAERYGYDGDWPA